MVVGKVLTPLFMARMIGKRMQKKGVVVNDDEYYAYDDGAYDDDEDKEIQLIRKKTNKKNHLGGRDVGSL